jgi:hypothetical protein
VTHVRPDRYESDDLKGRDLVVLFSNLVAHAFTITMLSLMLPPVAQRSRRSIITLRRVQCRRSPAGPPPPDGTHA